MFFLGFKNVSERLAEKTQTIGGAKDLAMDLQKRANDLAAQASNKLSFLSGKLAQKKNRRTNIYHLKVAATNLYLSSYFRC